MRSLRRRLAWSLAASLAALFLLQWAVVSLVLREVAWDYASDRLAREAEALLAALEVGPGSTLQLDLQRVDPAFQRVFSGHYFVIGSTGQVLRSRSMWDTELVLPIATAEEERLTLAGPQRQQLLVLSKGYRMRGQLVSIAVGEDISAHVAMLNRLQWIYGIASLAILALLVALQRLVVDRSLLPLRAVREDLRRIQQGDLYRIHAQPPEEIAPLVTEVNALLDAMRERLGRSRQALGNLAHALKTQLALLTHELEQPAAQAERAQADRLRAPVDAMARLVQRELKRARLAGGGLPGQRTDVGETVQALREALQKIHADRALEWEVSVAPGLTFEGDPEDLMELVGNLLDNACKWARSRVRVTGAEGDALMLTIEDDGPGMDPASLKALPRRGARADETIPGHGLGIAISAEVAHSYRGSVDFERSEALGGMRAQVSLPRQSHPAP
jgi:signal transduction histidine kinase